MHTLVVRLMTSRLGTLLGLMLCWLPPGAANGGEAVDRSLLSVERIFGKPEFKTADWGPAKWLKDGSGYTTLEKSEKTRDAKDLVRYEASSGKRRIVVAASMLIPAGEKKPLAIADYAWSADGQRMLLFTNTKRVWRRNTRGDYWVLEVRSGRLQKLGGEAEPSTLMFAKFSPDGRRVAYVRRNNLFVQDLVTLKVTQLTRDGSDTIVNGTGDWVYEEEFDLRDGFRWSPDGRSIAYWQFDTSGVPEFQLINNTDGLYPKLTVFKYPKVGQTNSACRVGIIASSGGPTRWLDTNADPRGHYIPQMEWGTDSRWVHFQQLNRLQNTNVLYRADAATGELVAIFTDKDEAWVDAMENWEWIRKGRTLLWLSEQDGWRHLYAVRRSGKTAKLLTPGGYDVVSIAGLDKRGRHAYVIASPENPTQRYLYCVSLDGSGELKRLTPADQPGTHSYDLSPNGRWAFHTYSAFDRPPVIEMVSLPEHRRVRTLVDNRALVAKLSELKGCTTEFFRVGAGDVELDAWCIKPPGFDPTRKYPLLIHVYGEPAGQTAADRWGGDNYLWHCMLAQRGYLVMSFDNRGTPAPRGRQWRKSIYRQVGIMASADQAAALRAVLKSRPYIDAKRVGVWGWSGGGSMTLNAMFRYPDLYTTGIAIAFISNQRFYDTIYQERYMGLPADNEAGYRDGSPITFAGQLKGNLMLIHGTGDDNCHYQNFEVLVNELIKRDKPFSMMSYPNRTHSISEGENTRRHLYQTMTRYLEERLPIRSAAPGNEATPGKRGSR